MGLCVDCKYHQTKNDCSDSILNRRAVFAPRGHYCTNIKNSSQDFVTGETFNANCYQKNAFGECLYFEEANKTDTPEESEENPENKQES